MKKKHSHPETNHDETTIEIDFETFTKEQLINFIDYMIQTGTTVGEAVTEMLEQIVEEDRNKQQT